MPDDNMLPLPAEEAGPRGRGRFGLVRPDDIHIRRSADALRALAASTNQAGEGGTTKRIRLGHVVNKGILSMFLYGFPILDFDTNQQPIDPMHADTDLRFAIVANHPVALQVQVVLSFLGDLVARHEYISELEQRQLPEEIADIDRRVMGIDRLSQEDVVDDLRLGWEAAASRLLRRARDTGVRFELVYDGDLLPTLADVAGRLPIAKKAYNSMDLVRKAVDRTVGVIGRTDPTVVGNQGPELIRELVQQVTTTSALRRYVSHLFRDSLVCGNGYLLLSRDEPFTMYCLDPADVDIIKDGRYRLSTREPRVIRDPVIHFRGLEQTTSSFGISLLEPAFGLLAMQSAMDSAGEFVRMHMDRPSLPEQVRRELRNWASMRERVQSDVAARLERLMPVPLSQLKDGDRPLYFDGHERY